MLSKARWISTDGGPREALISVRSVPLVFHRNDTTVVILVSGRFDRFVAWTKIWSMARRAGRAFARSSSFTVQLLSERAPMDAASEFVIFENWPTPFVT